PTPPTAIARCGSCRRNLLNPRARQGRTARGRRLGTRRRCPAIGSRRPTRRTAKCTSLAPPTTPPSPNTPVQPPGPPREPGTLRSPYGGPGGCNGWFGLAFQPGGCGGCSGRQGTFQPGGCACRWVLCRCPQKGIRVHLVPTRARRTEGDGSTRCFPDEGPLG